MKKEVEQFLKTYKINTLQDLCRCIKTHKQKLNSNLIYTVAEILNPNRSSNSAYFTDKIICQEIFKVLPKFEDKASLKILEPSVGAVAFLLFIAEYFNDRGSVEI